MRLNDTSVQNLFQGLDTVYERLCENEEIFDELLVFNDPVSDLTISIERSVTSNTYATITWIQETEDIELYTGSKQQLKEFIEKILQFKDYPIRATDTNLLLIAHDTQNETLLVLQPDLTMKYRDLSAYGFDKYKIFECTANTEQLHAVFRITQGGIWNKKIALYVYENMAIRVHNTDNTTIYLPDITILLEFLQLDHISIEESIYCSSEFEKKYLSATI